MSVSEISNKIQIKAALRKSFAEVLHVVELMDESTFKKPKAEGKWSPYEIMGHLWLSSQGIPKIMSMPKEQIKDMFGVLERPEKGYDEAVQSYYDQLGNGVKAPSQFVFSPKKELDKETMCSKFKKVLDDHTSVLDNWSEADLSTYCILHPALGTLSLREMMFFTDFHTNHHCKQISNLSE